MDLSGSVIIIGGGGATPTPTPATQGYETFVTGLDASGRILGHFQGTTYYEGAFTWKAGVTTDLSPAGARSSVEYQMSAGGWIAAGYVDASGGNHVFAWHEGTFFDYPLPSHARVSRVWNIDDAGRILGAYFPDTQSYAPYQARSFLAKDGVMTELTPAGARASSVVAFNAAGWIAGTFMDMSWREHAFAWRDGVFTELAPGDGISSSVVAMNAAGDVLVNSSLSAGTGQSPYGTFLWRDGVRSILSLHDAATGHQYLYGSGLALNERGDVMGTVTDTYYPNLVGAFWRNGELTLIATPTGSTRVTPVALSESGMVAGTFYGPKPDYWTSGTRHAFQWKDGVFTDIAVPIDSVYGDVAIKTIDATDHIFGSYHTYSTTLLFTWTDAGLTLVPAGAIASDATTILPSGRVLGWFSKSKDWRHPNSGPFTWKDGVFVDLNPDRLEQINALSMNASGQAVGYFYGADGYQALTWRGGRPMAINPRGAYSSSAKLINDAGQIAGIFTDTSYINSYAFFVDANGFRQVVVPPFAPAPILPRPPSVTPTPSPTPQPSTSPEETPPRVKVSGATRRSTSAAFVILNGKASGSHRVLRVEISQNGGLYHPSSGSVQSWYGLFDLRPGRNVFLVRALDTMGSLSKVERIVVTRR